MNYHIQIIKESLKSRGINPDETTTCPFCNGWGITGEEDCRGNDIECDECEGTGTVTLFDLAFAGALNRYIRG